MAEKLRVLMINGSPRANGNTSVGLKEMEKILQICKKKTSMVDISRRRMCRGRRSYACFGI